MTGRIEKTVFISYRRTNLPWALAIYQELTHHGYDVFFDYLSIPGGDFENIIIENIKGRAHFVVILTPSALERCYEPNDWLRREIETAMDEKRNILPLMLESFDFGNPSTVKALTGKLEKLKKYNGLRLHSEYFFEGMNRLREQFLNVSLDAVIHPILESSKPVIEEHQVAASEANPVEKEELTAQEWFERGYVFSESENFDEAIRCYTEAIRLNPDNASAYNNRGEAFKTKEDFESAISDYNKAIHLNPTESISYSNRGLVLGLKDDFEGAISDFNKAISLNPKLGEAYAGRGGVYFLKQEFDDALKDFEEVIRLNIKPHLSEVYLLRGMIKKNKSDFEGALTDINEFIQINPNYANSYYSRSQIWEHQKNYSKAIDDYQKYLELGGGKKFGDRKEIKEKIMKLKSKLTKKKPAKKKDVK